MILFRRNKIKNAFTIIELIIVIIIIGILMWIISKVSNMKDVQSYKNTFISAFIKSVISNKIEIDWVTSYDVNYKYCPWEDPENCEWDDNCIVWKYNWEGLGNGSLEYKYVVNNIKSYRLCPKFLPDWTKNESYAFDSSHQNPSLELIFNMDDTEQTLRYPIY